MNPPTSPRKSPDAVGRYEVLEELGRGSMGVVLLAHDPALGRRVALKFLRPDLKLNDEERTLLMRRMAQEAQAIARVSHPGIVALHDIGEDEKRGTYLVFEHARGPTLHAVLQRGRLTAEGTARLARELGNALEAAHAASIVHRDIKPGNIILTEEGSRIADFGVARLPDSTLTKAGARLGTPAYSAPECIRDGEHSPKSDQFSMAACLYEGLSGRRAYPGEDAVKVARAIEREAPVPIAKALGMAPLVDETLLRALHRDPEKRFPSCRQFGQALSEALIGQREPQATLPNDHTLRRLHGEDRKRALGTAVLWALVGATIATIAFRLTTEQLSQPKSPVIQAPDARPAYLSPMPATKR